MSDLLRQIAARALQALLVALVVGVLSFLLVEALPGDQAFRIAAGRYGEDMVSTAAADAVRQELGLDRPMGLRLTAWLGNLVTLNLGVSLVTGERVTAELAHQFGATLALSIGALLLSIMIGPPLGVLMALRPGGLLDAGGLVISAAFRALPSFVLGVILMVILAGWAGILPAAGYGEASSWVLPAFTLALGLAAVSSRVTRDTTLSVMQSEYVAFAATKGLSTAAIVWRHGLRNAAAPVISYLGVQLVHLVEGVVVVESLFAWPGIGHALVHAVVARDIPMVQGTALLMGLTFVALNSLVDLVCHLLDPRGSRR